MFEKINDNTYKYKNLTIKYTNGKYITRISLPRYAMKNRIYTIEATSEVYFIQQLNRTIKEHIEYEKKMSKREA